MDLAGEKATALKESAGEKTEKLMDYAGEKASALKDYALGKAGALRDYAVSSVALMSEKRTLEKNYQALGEWYAAQCVDGAPDAVADIVRAIHASQAKIAELRERGAKEPEEETP